MLSSWMVRKMDCLLAADSLGITCSQAPAGSPKSSEGEVACVRKGRVVGHSGELEHGRVGTPLRSWWNNSLWSWIQLEGKFEYWKYSNLNIENLEREANPAEALVNSRSWGTEELLGVKKCLSLWGRGERATLKQWYVFEFFRIDNDSCL